MASRVVVTSLEGPRLLATLRETVRSTQPQAIGMATAFLSGPGASEFLGMTASSPTACVRSIVGLSGCVTDPKAIGDLVKQGVEVRLAQHPGGVFHPKILVSGGGFLRSGEVNAPSAGYVGSANFTGGGLRRNVEVGIVTRQPELCQELAHTFALLWGLGQPATSSRVEAYSAGFAARQRRRAMEDLQFLEITGATRRGPVIPGIHALAAWAGLESFTGEYTLQVEFPKRAGEALSALLGTRDGVVDIRCADDVQRQMTYRFYRDNGMFRLNVPNDVPKVAWARAHHKGALRVSRRARLAPLRVEIITGDVLRETAQRSRALGCWGETSTREFGWY